MDTDTSHDRKPLKFFLIVFALSIPLWIIETMVNFTRSSLDFSITDILAAFTPIITASILVYKEDGCINLALYVGNNGVLELNLNWKVILVFSIEFIVSIIFGIFYVKKSRKHEKI